VRDVQLSFNEFGGDTKRSVETGTLFLATWSSLGATT
jgi:hypothetical protein